LVKPIRIIDDPVLRQKAESFSELDPKIIRSIAEDLVDTLSAQGGLGLAGNQIGVVKRIFVINAGELQLGNTYRVFVNPKVSFVDGIVTEEEGCLSIPGLYAHITRPGYVEFEAIELKPNGKLKDVKVKAEEFAARAFLHEIDHLDGILFVDYLDEDLRRILLAKWRNEYNKFSL